MAADRAVALVLHAHLPWCKGEREAEAWFFEAVARAYLPLLEIFRGLLRDGVRAKVALSLSPPLLAMLDDPELRRGARGFLAEQARPPAGGLPEEVLPAARALAERAQAMLSLWDALEGDLPTACFELARRGALELFTSAATHGFLPLLDRVPGTARAQVLVGAGAFERRFGARARGFWLPECGYTPGAEDWVAEAQARWFVVDAHAFDGAAPPPLSGVRSHVFLENGVAAFARDDAACAQVWNAQVGFPGSPEYLDFHHRPFGPRLHRVTGAGAKAPWEPAPAWAQARAHAAAFLAARAEGRPGLTVAAFDAELFGHWWFEGPVFLDALLRLLEAGDAVDAVAPGDWLAAHPEAELARLSMSSWGREGYAGTWLSSANQRLWPLLQRAGERMVCLADGAGGAGSQRAAELSALAGQLLLAQASDWPFLLDAGVSTALAARALEAHLACFLECADAALAGDWAPARALSARHNPLGQVDFRVYRSARG